MSGPWGSRHAARERTCIILPPFGGLQIVDAQVSVQANQFRAEPSKNVSLVPIFFSSLWLSWAPSAMWESHTFWNMGLHGSPVARHSPVAGMRGRGSSLHKHSISLKQISMQLQVKLYEGIFHLYRNRFVWLNLTKDCEHHARDFKEQNTKVNQ